MEHNTDKVVNKYEEIINLPHYVSTRRTQMSIKNRAAQFAPFAAVVGHGVAVTETARQTDKRKELDETEKAIINESLSNIKSQMQRTDVINEVEFVFFVPDKKKNGGQYIKKIGNVCKIDEYNREVHLEDGTTILIDEILHIKETH